MKVNFKNAKKILQEDVENYSLEELQRTRVFLIDCIRMINFEYGIFESVERGFFKIISDCKESYVPSDLHMLINLKNAFSKVCELEKNLLEGV